MLNRNRFFGLIALTAALSPYVLTLLTLLKITDTTALGFSLATSPAIAIAFGILGRREIIGKLGLGVAGLNVTLIVAILSIAYYKKCEMRGIKNDLALEQIRMEEKLEQIRNMENEVSSQTTISAPQ